MVVSPKMQIKELATQIIEMKVHWTNFKELSHRKRSLVALYSTSYSRIDNKWKNIQIKLSRVCVSREFSLGKIADVELALIEIRQEVAKLKFKLKPKLISTA